MAPTRSSPKPSNRHRRGSTIRRAPGENRNPRGHPLASLQSNQSDACPGISSSLVRAKDCGWRCRAEVWRSGWRRQGLLRSPPTDIGVDPQSAAHLARIAIRAAILWLLFSLTRATPAQEYLPPSSEPKIAVGVAALKSGDLDGADKVFSEALQQTSAWIHNPPRTWRESQSARPSSGFSSV